MTSEVRNKPAMGQGVKIPGRTELFRRENLLFGFFELLVGDSALVMSGFQVLQLLTRRCTPTFRGHNNRFRPATTAAGQEYRQQENDPDTSKITLHLEPPQADRMEPGISGQCPFGSILMRKTVQGKDIDGCHPALAGLLSEPRIVTQCAA